MQGGGKGKWGLPHCPISGDLPTGHAVHDELRDQPHSGQLDMQRRSGLHGHAEAVGVRRSAGRRRDRPSRLCDPFVCEKKPFSHGSHSSTLMKMGTEEAVPGGPRSRHLPRTTLTAWRGGRQRRALTPSSRVRRRSPAQRITHTSCEAVFELLATTCCMSMLPWVTWASTLSPSTSASLSS